MCLPLLTTLVKPLSEAHPAFGSASGPVDVQRYVDGRAHTLFPPDRPVHFWFAPPWHDQSRTSVPLALPQPEASRHRPDRTPTIVPSGFTRHCWLSLPLHVQICTGVPDVVAPPRTSRHLLPYTVSRLLSVKVHCWLIPPWQSQMCTFAPSVWLTPATSRHRPESTPRTSLVVAA